VISHAEQRGRPANRLIQGRCSRWSRLALIYVLVRWGGSRPTTGRPWPQSGWSGSAGLWRNGPHHAPNRLFLLACARPLTADPAWDGTRFRASPEQGLAHLRPDLLPAGPPARPSTGRAARSLGYGALRRTWKRSWLPAYRRHESHDLLAMLEHLLANDSGGCCGMSRTETNAGNEAEPIKFAAAWGVNQTARTT